ncbi:hypothetical protein [Undibacterium flavidum]|uniref:Flagellar motor switch protein FliG C-terminal domain-containing protein n=1 Tax=Undibacterium flavidum TaxID=2762297 RepID=A0ABR6YER9_9BURK|nr:hypothetical protein [Undibacterium flavidum]MBC3875060.1 hypothetical protein [Undibacterium flavidum]
MHIREDKLQHLALMLHSLHPEDRDWLMGELVQEQVELLMPLLAELSSLGIPRDRQIIDSFLAREKHAVSEVIADRSRESILDKIDRVSANRIYAVLCDETPELIASVLNIHDWSWYSALMKLFDVRKARLIQISIEKFKEKFGSSLDSQSKPELLNQSLCLHLFEELQKQECNNDSLQLVDAFGSHARNISNDENKTSKRSISGRLKAVLQRSSSVY